MISGMYIISHKCVVDINYLLVCTILLYSIYASSKFCGKMLALKFEQKMFVKHE